MLLYELSSSEGGLLLSILMLKDAGRNYYAVAGVDPVVSDEPRHFADDGHEAFLGPLPHLLRVGHTLVAPHRNVHSSSLPPSHRGRDQGKPRRESINVPSVQGYEGWRNFGEAARKSPGERPPMGLRGTKPPENLPGSITNDRGSRSRTLPQLLACRRCAPSSPTSPGSTARSCRRPSC